MTARRADGDQTRHQRCATCQRVQHPYLFAYLDRSKGTRDYRVCLPCRSHALNVRDGMA